MMQNDNVDMEAYARLHPTHFQKLHQPKGVTIHLCLCACLFRVLPYLHIYAVLPKGRQGELGLLM